LARRFKRTRKTTKTVKTKISLNRLHWLRNYKDIAGHRELLINRSKGLCAITKEPLESPVMDHAHLGSEYEGHCRGVISSFSNMLEGRFRRDFNKYARRHTNVSFADYLICMGNYLNGDYSREPLHHMTVEEYKKRLNSKTKPVIVQEIVKDYGKVTITKDGNELALSNSKVTKVDLIQKACELLIQKLEEVLE
jgi:hypothetical protein